MADIFSKEKRSKIMSRIRSKDTSIEIRMASLLRKAGIKFRRYPKMLGNPDFIINGRKIVIFCDGDFWHGYSWKSKGNAPSKKYWQKKIQGNIDRDKRITRELIMKGWKVIRLWEHEINIHPDKCVCKIRKALEFLDNLGIHP